MRYRRKKTAPVSVSLQRQQPVDGHSEKRNSRVCGLAEVMVGKTVVYTGAKWEFELKAKGLSGGG
jgi:hypothetical protein